MLKPSLLFYEVPGPRSNLVVAAPHHGTVPGSDYCTKEVATMLAGRLGATLVVAENMRPQVDLNKDPAMACGEAWRDLVCRYQTAVLAEPVNLLLEIHGHIHGRYDLEISNSYDFNPGCRFDREFAERLSCLQTTMNWQLNGRWLDSFPLCRPTLGIYPFDRDVVMKATKTYLFQQIRVLQLRGRRIFALHIEIYRNYKTSDSTSPIYHCQEALVAALAESIKVSFPDL